MKDDDENGMLRLTGENEGKVNVSYRFHHLFANPRRWLTRAISSWWIRILILVLYLCGVWLTAYKIETTSMDKNVEADLQNCPHPSKFRISNKEHKPNPWLLQSVHEVVFSSRLLDHPVCLGSYLKNFSEYKYYDYRIRIYDEIKDLTIFEINKNSSK